MKNQFGRASDNVAFCPGQTSVAPLRVTPPAPVQNERYRTPAILVFSWRLAMRVRDNVRIRDREGRLLQGSVVWASKLRAMQTVRSELFRRK